MNPFQTHADNMKVYEAMIAAPVGAPTVPGAPTQGTASFVTGTPPVAKSFPAVIDVFSLQQLLQPSGGGFTQSFAMMAEAIVQKAALPADAIFRSGLRLTACPLGGSVYQCMVMAVEDTFTEWRIKLQDVNYKA